MIESARRRAYHRRDQLSQFLLIDLSVIGDVVPKHVEMIVAGEERWSYLHVEGDGETIVEITLAGSGDSQEKLFEIDRAIVVGVEGIESKSDYASARD